MIQDLHAHTYYSFCSDDSPETVINTAIREGIKQIGICDHNYGIGCARTDFCYDKGARRDADYGKTLVRYFDHIKSLKEKYRYKIDVKCGIEVCTLITNDSYALPKNADISFFDYCLVENLGDPRSFINNDYDIFQFSSDYKCLTGIAHTDLFKYINKLGVQPYAFLQKMAKHKIFWELNVNFDSMHNFKTHDYVTEFLKNKEQQELIKKTGVRLSVGFDSHLINEYKSERVKSVCSLIKQKGFPLIFE